MTVDDVYLGNGASELIVMAPMPCSTKATKRCCPRLITRCTPLRCRCRAAVPVHYMCDEKSDWNPDIADIRAKISPRTKAIVVINPNNPRGAVSGKPAARNRGTSGPASTT